MNQINRLFRSSSDGLFHYCQACDRLHILPSSWSFNGDYEKPTFSPSFKHSWGKNFQKICHYTITDGNIYYCGDCTHEFVGTTMQMVALPANYKDGIIE